MNIRNYFLWPVRDIVNHQTMEGVSEIQGFQPLFWDTDMTVS